MDLAPGRVLPRAIAEHRVFKVLLVTLLACAWLWSGNQLADLLGTRAQNLGRIARHDAEPTDDQPMLQEDLARQTMEFR
jgi:hypothetical protein